MNTNTCLRGLCVLMLLGVSISTPVLPNPMKINEEAPIATIATTLHFICSAENKFQILDNRDHMELIYVQLTNILIDEYIGSLLNLNDASEELKGLAEQYIEKIWFMKEMAFNRYWQAQQDKQLYYLYYQLSRLYNMMEKLSNTIIITPKYLQFLGSQNVQA